MVESHDAPVMHQSCPDSGGFLRSEHFPNSAHLPLYNAKTRSIGEFS